MKLELAALINGLVQTIFHMELWDYKIILLI